MKKENMVVINGHTPSEMFLMKGRLNSCKNNKTVKQIKSVTHVKKSGGSIISEESSITKPDLLSQLDHTLREQLSPHTWEIINYNPLKLYIAHRERKQIILASIKSNKISKQDNYYNLSFISEINSINLSKIIIGAIPVEISRHEDPLGLSTANKYTIKFETQIETQNTFTLGPSSLDEIVQELHNRTLILDHTKAVEALSAIILSKEKDNKVTYKERHNYTRILSG